MEAQTFADRMHYWTGRRSVGTEFWRMVFAMPKAACHALLDKWEFQYEVLKVPGRLCP
jgi:hypothetical protein